MNLTTEQLIEELTAGLETAIRELDRLQQIHGWKGIGWLHGVDLEEVAIVQTALGMVKEDG